MPWAIPAAFVGMGLAWWWAKGPARGLPQASAPGTITAQDFTNRTSVAGPWPTTTNFDGDWDVLSSINILTSDRWWALYNTLVEPLGNKSGNWAISTILPGGNAGPVAPYPLETPWPAPRPKPDVAPAPGVKINAPGRFRPDPNPITAPAPGLLPEPILNPNVVANPQPVPSPIIVPGSPPVAFDIGPHGASLAKATGRPPRGVQERKSRSSLASAVFWTAFNVGTELMDFLESVLRGFGVEPRGWRYNIETLMDILDSPRPPQFDMQAFVESLIANEVEDQLVGRASGALNKSLRELGISIYGGITPGRGFI